MIENRLRLEKQIMAGRQAVRKLTRTNRLQNSSPESASPGRVFELGGFEASLPADSDAERAFGRGAEHFFKHTRIAGSPRPDWFEQVNQDMRRRDARRRKAVSELFENDNEPMSEPTHDRSPGNIPNNNLLAPPSTGTTAAPRGSFLTAPSSPTMFFNRLRNPSFPGFPSPFSTVRRGNNNRQPSTSSEESTESHWSSESDSVLATLPVSSFGRTASETAETMNPEAEEGEELDSVEVLQ
jgi:hypothetical protein